MSSTLLAIISSLLCALSVVYSDYSQNFENTQETTLLWTLISTGQNMQLHGFIIEHPSVLMLRSEDGRGALWWAWEYKNAEALAILAVNGVDLHYAQTDANGQKPYELCDSYQETLQEAQSLIEAKKVEKEHIKEKIKEEKEKMFLNDEEPEDEDDDDAEEDDEMDNEFMDARSDDDDDDEFFLPDEL